MMKTGLKKSVFKHVGRILFIRHGEKISDEYTDLSPTGVYRAEHLIEIFGRDATRANGDAYGTPEVIYAMRQGPDTVNDSNRPFLTVLPLAEKLGMKPKFGEAEQGDNPYWYFNNQFVKDAHQELIDDINTHAEEFKDKTVLLCWEHKEIPKLVKDMGLSHDKLHWGLHPTVKQLDGGEDSFTPIWAFTLTEPDDAELKVYQEFKLVPEANDAGPDYEGPWTMEEHEGPVES